MIEFVCAIKKFKEKGEKSGWTYIEVTNEVAGLLAPGNKKSFRVKGWLDNYNFHGFALIPMGGGNFILPLNSATRKQLRKTEGATLHVKLDIDITPTQINTELMHCLSDEPCALAYFNNLPPSHQNYYSKWIESAKTIETKTKRIAQAVTACSRQQHYGEMVRALKDDKAFL